MESAGSPSEDAVLADALTIHDTLEARLRPEATFAYGVSLGARASPRTLLIGAGWTAHS